MKGFSKVLIVVLKVMTLSRLMRASPTCPPCVSSEVGIEIRQHKQIRGSSVYECGNGTLFFTHPPPSMEQLDTLYRSKSTAFSNAHATHGPREKSQFEYIQNMELEALDGPTGRTIVEVGCQHAGLLSLFGRLNDTLVCIEPSPLFTPERLLQPTGAHYHVVQKVWTQNASKELQNVLGTDRPQINVFLSSHVIEHMGDLCEWARVLFELMAPGGVVFTEVPNHTRDYVKYSHHSVWGKFHLSLPSPQGLMKIMMSAGFTLGQISTHSSFTTVGAHGKWIRSVFIKPVASKVGCGLDGMGPSPGNRGGTFEMRPSCS